MTPPRQFFQEGSGRQQAVRSVRRKVAIYQLPGKARNGEQLAIAVECVEGGGNVPRNAAFSKFAKKLETDITKELESVTAVAEVGDTVLTLDLATAPGAP